MTKQEALKEINETQDFYVSKLVDIINGRNQAFDEMKEIDFTSPTGTGKTIMVSKLINQMPDYFFVITTLSKGQLRYQIEAKLNELVEKNNYIVFGLNEYTKNTILQKKDFLSILPSNKKIIWIRDEGHIATNRWQEILRNLSYLIINFSATNKTNNGINCNFTHTMMLRTVIQDVGTIEDALDRLQEVKKTHAKIQGYNPCALFRLFYKYSIDKAIEECRKRNLKFINITDESYDMAEICSDNNEYDVIINKLKITEGIDLKRCHVIFMDTTPRNETTIIQIIGRARRNALFWRNDINILDKENEYLLAETRQCYIFYNSEETMVGQSNNGELLRSFCDTVSIENLKPGIIIDVDNGRLKNGLYVLELFGKTGKYKITYDKALEANVVNNPSFYRKEVKRNDDCFVLDLADYDYSIRKIYFKNDILDYFELEPDFSKHKYDKCKYHYYIFKIYLTEKGVNFNFSLFEKLLNLNDEHELVDPRRFIDYIKMFGVEEQWHDCHKHFLSYIKYYGEAQKYACRKRYTPFSKRALFVYSSDKKQSMHLHFDLIRYIESIEVVDFSVASKIKEILNKYHNVVQVAANKYKYSNHSFSEYLSRRKINTINDLKEIVLNAKGKQVLGTKVDVWKRILTKIKSVEEIDTFEVDVTDLSGLNSILDLGLNDKEISIYINGNYPTKIVSIDDYNPNYYPSILWLNRKTMIPQMADNKNLYIYRQTFLNVFESYEKTINDKEIAVIGPDLMKYTNHHYIEDSAVTSKINQYCKFNKFISRTYKEVLEQCSSLLFSGKNNFNFDSMCNSCLGFCVEFFAKMVIYGDELYKPLINEVLHEAKQKEINDIIRIRVAMLAYKQEMADCYGSNVLKYIPTIRIENLIKDKYKEFVTTVSELGRKAASFIKKELYNQKQPKYNIDPDLSVNHISALCDFITKDIILDLKCTSSITETHIKQVLAYHYLSTKRTDLNIQKLIVYDAVTGKNVTINLLDYSNKGDIYETRDN